MIKESRTHSTPKQRAFLHFEVVSVFTGGTLWDRDKDINCGMESEHEADLPHCHLKDLTVAIPTSSTMVSMRLLSRTSVSSAGVCLSSVVGSTASRLWDRSR